MPGCAGRASGVSRSRVALELHIEGKSGSYAPESPRLAQRADGDLLAAGVALRQNPQRLARPQRNSESLRGKRARHRIGPA